MLSDGDFKYNYFMQVLLKEVFVRSGVIFQYVNGKD